MTPEELRILCADQIAVVLSLGFEEEGAFNTWRNEIEIIFHQDHVKVHLLYDHGVVSWEAHMWLMTQYKVTYEEMIDFIYVPARKYLARLNQTGRDSALIAKLAGKVAKLEAKIAEMRLSPYPGEDYLAARADFAELITP